LTSALALSIPDNMKTTALLFCVATLALGHSAFADSLPQVELHTSLGDIVVEIDNVHAPITGNNFLALIDAGAYTGGTFYRTVTAANTTESPASQIIQGGISASATDAPPIMLEKTSATGLSNTAGTISMARMTNINSATSAIFINITNNASAYDDGGVYGATGGYAVFGHVVSGMSVVTSIQMQPSDSSQDLTPPITIITGMRLATNGDGGTTILPDFGPGAQDMSAHLADASAPPTENDASLAPHKKSSGCSYAGSTPDSVLPLAGLMLAFFALRRRRAA
jgi:peptidyl-prolyl cis-trans isomerase A (cyclophilin A)